MASDWKYRFTLIMESSNTGTQDQSTNKWSCSSHHMDDSTSSIVLQFNKAYVYFLFKKSSSFLQYFAWFMTLYHLFFFLAPCSSFFFLSFQEITNTNTQTYTHTQAHTQKHVMLSHIHAHWYIHTIQVYVAKYTVASLSAVIINSILSSSSLSSLSSVSTSALLGLCVMSCTFRHITLDFVSD